MDGCKVDLTREEAIVLFELVARFTETDALTIADQAEARVLWDICCTLETQLVEPLRVDWPAELQRARDVVRDLDEPPGPWVPRKP